MATSKITLTSSWQLVAADGAEFIIENSSAYPAQITFQASTPSAEAAFHPLLPGEGIVRMGLTGNIYARDDANTSGVAFLVVTT